MSTTTAETQMETPDHGASQLAHLNDGSSALYPAVVTPPVSFTSSLFFKLNLFNAFTSKMASYMQFLSTVENMGTHLLTKGP